MNKPHPAYAALTGTSSLMNLKISKHIEAWKDCENCALCKTARYRVLGKGILPCDILLVGEAPGNSENDLGKPFVGKAGKLLDDLIKRSRYNFYRKFKIKWDYTTATTNLISCIPTDGEPLTHNNGYVFRTPTNQEAVACSTRLQQFVQLAAPKGIILFGGSVQKMGKASIEAACASIFPKEKMPLVAELVHPSYINRLGGFDSPRFTGWLRATTSFLKQVYDRAHS